MDEFCLTYKKKFWYTTELAFIIVDGEYGLSIISLITGGDYG